MLNKKCSIIIAYLCLERESERQNPLSQTTLAQFATDVGCPCDRKTIGRDIKALISMGCPIRKTAKGFYMDQKTFTIPEVRFLLDCVKAATDGTFDKESLLTRLYRVLAHSYTR